jgi:hypothetical protein
MDNRSNPRTKDRSAENSTGCCGGKSDAQPQTKAEPRGAETARDRPTKSGCCCGQN